jgi:hypothetical protein
VSGRNPGSYPKEALMLRLSIKNVLDKNEQSVGVECVVINFCKADKTYGIRPGETFTFELEDSDVLTLESEDVSFPTCEKVT